MLINTPLSRIDNASLLQRIYQHILSQPLTDNVSLLSGQMGYAVLEAYVQRFYGLPTSEQTWERVEAGLDAIQAGELIHSFAGGIAGVAWGFLHLTNQGLLSVDEIDPQDILAGLDEPLFEVSMDFLRAGDFDYLHGGLSACLYYLERSPTPALAHYIDQLVQQLSDMAVRYPNGDITWAYQDDNLPSALYNLGLSHGTSSIIAILSLLYERGYARPRCAELILGSLQWVWNQRNHKGISVFSNFAGPEHLNSESRLAWCYGDLGIANTLWMAGSILRLPIWQTRAYEVMLKASLRRTPIETMIKDAVICHGSAGSAYQFRKFAKRTQHPQLTQAAEFWLQELVTYILPEDQDDIFLRYATEAGQYVSERGLLDGTAGVGLVLLGELGAPTTWDRFLLLS
ncbi:lanthionine synthetase C family protein [Spirosoma gilvum]